MPNVKFSIVIERKEFLKEPYGEKVFFCEVIFLLIKLETWRNGVMRVIYKWNRRKAQDRRRVWITHIGSFSSDTYGLLYVSFA